MSLKEMRYPKVILAMVFISKLSLTPNIRISFEFQRRQVPLVVSFAIKLPLIRVEENHLKLSEYFYQCLCFRMINYILQLQ